MNEEKKYSPTLQNLLKHDVRRCGGSCLKPNEKQKRKKYKNQQQNA